MGCYIFGIRAVVPLGSVGVFLIVFLVQLWYLLARLMILSLCGQSYGTWAPSSSSS